MTTKEVEHYKTAESAKEYVMSAECVNGLKAVIDLVWKYDHKGNTRAGEYKIDVLQQDIGKLFELPADTAKDLLCMVCYANQQTEWKPSSTQNIAAEVVRQVLRCWNALNPSDETPSTKKADKAGSVADEIRKYAALLKDGCITQAEYDAVKKKLMGVN